MPFVGLPFVGLPWRLQPYTASVDHSADPLEVDVGETLSSSEVVGDWLDGGDGGVVSIRAGACSSYVFVRHPGDTDQALAVDVGEMLLVEVGEMAGDDGSALAGSGVCGSWVCMSGGVVRSCDALVLRSGDGGAGHQMDASQEQGFMKKGNHMVEEDGRCRGAISTGNDEEIE